jgi:putative membrane protein
MFRMLSFAVLVAFAPNVRAQDSSSIPLGDEYFAMKAYSEGMAEVARS